MKLLATCCVAALTLGQSIPSQAGFWQDVDTSAGINRTLTTSPLNNPVAISAHNAYTEGYLSVSQNLSATQQKISNAIDANVDLIELDLVYNSSQQAVKVSHNPGASQTYSAYLDDVLAYSKLQQGNQLLFIELKEQSLNTAYVGQMIDSFVSRGYVSAGRPLFLRSFSAGRSNLQYARQYLNTHYPSLSPYLYLSELFGKSTNPTSLRGQVDQAANDGFDMVEFQYQSTNLGAHLHYARDLGLGTGLWTIPASMGEVGLTLFREETDELTTDYNLNAAKQIVEENNNLIYFNTADQNGTGNSLTYYRSGATPYALSIGFSDSPALATLSDTTVLDGNVAEFKRSTLDKLSLYDADQTAANGFLVSVLAQFNNLSVPDGETRAIVNKADSAGFALELYNPAGLAATQLRYGVHINGAYRYVTYPASFLSKGKSYYITGAYDGNGGVRMYMNSSQISAGSSYTGGVTQNNSPVVLAADPQGSTATRFHTDVRVQMLSVQDWRNH